MVLSFRSPIFLSCRLGPPLSLFSLLLTIELRDGETEWGSRSLKEGNNFFSDGKLK